ncbi:PhzF family phenazine biosynthesis protein [Arthrobacter sp. zg-Y1171]|uniref:PhzF family phenazine biosynthesis protein n=1 Tax=Arthrobacter sp. zg-Y1171 TaxID=2964610 RepID=UPI002104F921|nr:PhzF family phenazine biosynthesis protein [Arthrobacter sp. zg-Y1171]MCQ1996508.1 PhzF family phenazine biosynthesis protein [Arthrobacter sp. zg-Y1171]UWX82111.1 PhzF family phenazine biosynthesis protein [Arthrobacter sp. zg-Y1171]
MKVRPYSEVDVFSSEPYRGNALAVVHDADGLSAEEMQRFATWTNLSETTFLLPPSSPKADYRVRIFTAMAELPFAGHPTLGSAEAWLDAGGSPRLDGTLIQECEAGLIPIRVAEDQLAFEAPPLTRYEPVDEPLAQRIAAILGIPRENIRDASWLVNGPRWIGVRLSSAQEVLSLQPDPGKAGDLEIGVVGPHEPTGETQFEVRAFVGGDPVWEDPVTGSLNAGLARWLIDTGLATPPFTASQGTVLGRRGRVHISLRDGKIWVGGQVMSCIEGTVRL